MYGLSYEPSPVLLSATPLGPGVSLAAVALEAVVSSDGTFAFFFLADLDSDLTAGF